MHYSLRIRVLQYRQMTRFHRVPTTPLDETRKVYLVKHGFAIIRANVRRNGRKRSVSKRCTYGKPKSHGVNKLKPKRSLRSVAQGRVVKRGGNLQLGQNVMYKFYELVLVDSSYNVISTFWICVPYHEHRQLLRQRSACRKCRGLGKGQ